MKSIQLAALLLSIFLVSSFSPNIMPFTRADKWIPKDLDTRKTVLLVANYSIMANPNASYKEMQDKVNAKMLQVLKDEYPYKFEMVDWRALNDPKYSDLDMYRFVLADGVSEHEALSSSDLHITGHEFFIYDRKLKKSYPSAGHGNSYPVPAFKPAVAALARHLEGLK